jgi:hypothetical protein
MNVTTVSGGVGTDAWALLAPGATTNPSVQIIGGSFNSWQARLLPVGRTGNEYCVDMLDPYNYDASLAFNNDATHGGQDLCAQRGFVMQNTAFSYRGEGLLSGCEPDRR